MKTWTYALIATQAVSSAAAAMQADARVATDLIASKTVERTDPGARGFRLSDPGEIRISPLNDSR
ncbi:MAG: hypothetical protein AAF762_15115 [Pseudomonadota bacterium]